MTQHLLFGRIQSWLILLYQNVCLSGGADDLMFVRGEEERNHSHTSVDPTSCFLHLIYIAVFLPLCFDLVFPFLTSLKDPLKFCNCIYLPAVPIVCH